ncbi:MAG: hypothetical protein AB1486_17145 [Planctomycetota bacterium]
MAMARGWRTARLPDSDRALLEYAEKLARAPREMRGEDVQALRAAGFDDRAISDAAQVASYFSYINRIADGLGVDPESLPPLPGEPGAGGARTHT